MRSIFRNPSCISVGGDGEAKGVRADGIARLTAKPCAAAETPCGEAGKYATRVRGVITAEEQAPKKTRATCPSARRPVP